jgi:hypothetical protein
MAVIQMGDEVIVPDDPDGITVGVVTSEPNYAGKVRVDWGAGRAKANQWSMLDEDFKGKGWGFYSPASLRLAS